MKENTQKILTLLYSRSVGQPFTLTYEHLQLFLPDLTRSGLRSLTATLKAQGLVETERIVEETYLRLTPQGRVVIEVAIPCLQGSVSQEIEDLFWVIVIFQTAPAWDKQFRYLRSLMVKNRVIAVARGVYMYPQALPPALLTECRDRYRKSVMIGEVTQWQIGDSRAIAIEHFHLLDIIQSYSGISSEISRLTDRKKQFQQLNDQEKKAVSSLFDRLYSNLLEDYGLTPLFFPQIEGGVALLQRFQQLLG